MAYTGLSLAVLLSLLSLLQQLRRQSSTDLEEMKAGVEELRAQSAQVTLHGLYGALEEF